MTAFKRRLGDGGAGRAIFIFPGGNSSLFSALFDNICHKGKWP